MLALVVDDLTVRYLRRGRPAVEAVRGMSFQVEEGEVFGLLGPNGAGKTSALEVCEGFRRPTSGRVTVLGQNPNDRSGARSLPQDVGVVLQEIAVEPYLTVAEAVTRQAGYYRRPRPVAEVLEAVGLSEQRDARVKTLSGGQQRRLDLALGIVGRPRLLFLDEPTTGFDPTARRSAWQMIQRLRDDGTTVVLTTHYLEEAEALADRVCVVAAGRVVAQGPPQELAGRAESGVLIRFELPTGTRPVDLPTGPDDQCSVHEGAVTLRTPDPTAALHRLTGWAIGGGHELAGLQVTRPSLEDVYLELIAGGQA